MARTDTTGGNGYVIDNGTGAQVRTKLNQITAAINSLNSGSGDPSINTAFQPHIDTNTSLFRIRNAANNAYITLGNVSQENFGHAALTGATFTGSVIHNYTGALRLPVGTTAQRPASPNAGDIRFNSTTTEAEIFNGSIFTAVAGGAGATGGGNDQWVFENDQTVTQNYEISANKHAHSVSPTINNGVTITVPSGAILVIL
ncbi:MAG: hypothetical protein CM15mV115_290 [Caudoviricetes sp.]|nr:MAG: hypothetical protein CM15mV115_290 [Caudoviricetes sp.]